MLYKTVRKCYLFILLCLGQKDLGERTGIGQLQYTKAGSKKDLELVKSCGCSNVIGALGLKMKRLKNWLKKFDVRTSIEVLQKVALLRTTQIER